MKSSRTSGAVASALISALAGAFLLPHSRQAEALDALKPKLRDLNSAQRKILARRSKYIAACSSEPQKLINKMTNWQRSQWAKQGRPMTKEALTGFTELQRDQAA